MDPYGTTGGKISEDDQAQRSLEFLGTLETTIAKLKLSIEENENDMKNVHELQSRNEFLEEQNKLLIEKFQMAQKNCIDTRTKKELKENMNS